MSTKIQLRRDSAASWVSVNPILAQGEPGAETDTGKLKIGDGVTRWNLLSYVQPDASASGTENIWVASIADCTSLHIKTSKDGLNWTRAYNPQPKISSYGWQNAWYAAPMGGKIIYDLYVDYMGTETLGWSDNAVDYPNPVTFTNLPTTDAIDSYNYWDVKYLNGKFIAVGAYYEVASSGIARPFFAYSDDAKTWTYGNIDEAFTSNLVGDSGGKAEGIYINSVDWNGVGYLFSMEWDYNFGGSSLDNPPGMFYVSSLTTQLGTNNYFKPMIDNNYGLRRMTWNHDHWVALARQQWWAAPRVAFNSNTNPREGTWSIVDLMDTSPTGPQVVVFGDTTDGDNHWDAFTSGKIGSDYWDVIGHHSGRVMATKDKGATWVGSVPFNTFNSLLSVYYDGGEGSVVARFYKPPLSTSTYSTFSGDRVEIRYSGVEALNGIFYLNGQNDSNPEEWGLRLDRARTQNLSNPQAIVNGYVGSNATGLITFSRDAGSGSNNPYAGFGGFDSLLIADGKIVAINGHLWASSSNLSAINSWTLSIQPDVYTVNSYGTTGLGYGSAGRTNQNSLEYVSDSNLTTEFWKELEFGPTIPAGQKWLFDAFGRYTNQLVLAENFQVDVGGSNMGGATSMGMDGAGHWWLGYDARNNSTGGGSFTGGEWTNTTAIMNSDELEPGYADIVIATDLFNYNSGPYNWIFDREGKLTTPGLLHFDGTTITTKANPNSYADRPTVQIQGQQGYGTGEGGDIYIWAGYGTYNGGDIKIDAGGANSRFGTSTALGGGSIKIRAGYVGSTGYAGPVHIEGGNASAGHSGDIELRTWAGALHTGTVYIKTNVDQINSGNPGDAIVNGSNNLHMNTWQFDAAGKTILPGAVVASKTTAKVGVVSITTASDATLLDLNKQIQYLDVGDGTHYNYYLPDGVEGQIMHFVAKQSTEMHYITIFCDHIRYRNSATLGGASSGYGDWIPFSNGTFMGNGRTMGTGIFIDGAWNFDGGDVD
jgi:Major tropism determinant N-terminal domain